MKKNSIFKAVLATVLAAVLALPAPVQAADSYVSKLELEDAAITLGLDDIYMTDAEVTIVGDASTDITAVSANNSIAEVTELQKDEEGVTNIIIESYLTTGTTEIKVTTVGAGKNGKSLTATIKVEVVESIPEDPDDDDLDLDDDVEKDTRPDGEYPEADGSVTTIKTEGGKQITTNLKTLDNGNTEETVKTVNENGDYSVSVTTKDKDGKVIGSSNYSKTTASSGEVTLYSQVVKEDGSSFSGEMVLSADGQTIGYSTTRVNAKGEIEKLNYIVYDSPATVSTLGKEPSAINASGSGVFFKGGTSDNGMINLPEEITLLDKNKTVLPVTGIASGAIVKGTERVIVSENVTKIATGAFEGSGTKIITFRGKADKSVFEKNSLKGAGKKNGKGLTIYVTDKSSLKAVKKSLKTAGAKKAKVKVLEQ